MAAAIGVARTLALASLAIGLVQPVAAQTQPPAAGQEWRPFPATDVAPPLSLGQAAQAPGLAPPPFQASLTATVKESWTDNVALTSTNQRHDEISSIAPDVNLSA